MKVNKKRVVIAANNKEDDLDGVTLKDHGLRWHGGEMIAEDPEKEFRGVIKQKCAGLCADKTKRQVAIAVAMDSVVKPSEEAIATFMDIDPNDDTLRRIPRMGGRGIVVMDNIKQVAATDHCMAVCCYDLAIYLMTGRRDSKNLMTRNLVSTIWPEEKKSISKFGNPFYRTRDETEVETA